MIAARKRNGPDEGERRKLEAQALLEAHREVYVNRGRRALLQTLIACGQATADDVRDLVELPPGIDPKLFGSIPGPLARAGIIRRVGFTETCRPTAHARPVSVWALVDRHAAIAWMDSHPDEPDAEDGNGSLVPDSRSPQTPDATVAAVAPAQRSLF